MTRDFFSEIFTKNSGAPASESPNARPGSGARDAKRRRIVFVNRGAQTLAAEADGIRLSTHGVTLAYRRDNHRLANLIAQAYTSAASGHAMRALRPSGKRPYTILAGPVSRKYSGLSAVRPAVCIVITDPDRTTPFLKQRLQAIYGLTEAEAA